MTLGELIRALEKEPDRQLEVGFGNPHSYRGWYEQLAFEPMEDTTVAAMLREARGALGVTFTGWKGGEYQMSEHTDCHLAYMGRIGQELSPLALKALLSGIVSISDFQD